MSSKKQQRKQRRERAQGSESGKKSNPVKLFVLSIAAALIVVVVLGVVFRGEGPGEPPYPGAVWSDSHGHWH